MNEHDRLIIAEVLKRQIDDKMLREYAIYSAIWTLETYCRHRPSGLQIASDDRSTAPMIDAAMTVLEASPEVQIIRDEKFPNVKIVYERSCNRFFSEYHQSASPHL